MPATGPARGRWAGSMGSIPENLPVSDSGNMFNISLSSLLNILCLKHAGYGLLFKKYVELTRPKIESRDPNFFTGTRAHLRVSGYDGLFPFGSEFGPNPEIHASPVIQLWPRPANDAALIYIPGAHSFQASRHSGPGSWAAREGSVAEKAVHGTWGVPGRIHWGISTGKDLRQKAI